MRARGFSLVEFMVAIAIGLFLIAGLVYLIAETSRSRGEIERSSRQIENGRYALDRLAEDLRHAGFYSEYFSFPAAGEAGFPGLLSAAAPCAVTVATLPAGMPLPVQAYDGAGSIPSDLTGAGCTGGGLVAANYQTGTDILVVRRASTASKTKATAAADDGTSVYLQTTPVEYKIGLGSASGTFTLTFPITNTTATVDAPVRRHVVRIYFVSKCNVPASGATCNGTTDDGGVSIPTLKMLELGPGQAFTLLPVAEGIEHLQFDFGIDDTGDGVADRVEAPDASGCFSGGCAANVATRDWSNVVTAQVNIVARNTEPSPNYSDDKTYNLGIKGLTVATNDQYRRHAYTAQVRLNNVAMRRE